MVGMVGVPSPALNTFQCKSQTNHIKKFVSFHPSFTTYQIQLFLLINNPLGFLEIFYFMHDTIKKNKEKHLRR